MRSTQVTTWRKYSKREKQAYRARVARRRKPQVWVNGVNVTQYVDRVGLARHHHFADNLGSRIPTARVNGDAL